MANWKVKIDVADLWDKYSDDEDFGLFKEELIPKLYSYVPEISKKIGKDEAHEYAELVYQIELDANDIEEFDEYWQQVYDWADDNDVWLGTF